MSGSLAPIARIGLMAVGYYFGGPIGASIAGMAGSLLFPEKLPGASGPRLGDQEFTTGTEGQAIPLVYGSHVVAGNFIWAAPLDEVKNTEEQGGKGGPSQKITTYTYFLSFAVGLCEGTITGIPRIWENGKLIYDRRPQQPGESSSDYTKRLAASDELDEQMTIYTGSEDQLPDPVMESHEGVGEVSAHRGLAYVVFERRDVTDFGGRPAQYQFEVTRADLIYEQVTELATDALYPWLFGSIVDPRNPLNEYVYNFAGQSYGPGAPAFVGVSPGWDTSQTEQEALDAFVTAWEAGLPSISVGDLNLVAHIPEATNENAGGASSTQVGPFNNVLPHERVTATLHYNEIVPATYEAFAASSAGGESSHYTGIGATSANAAYRTQCIGRNVGPWYMGSEGGIAESGSYPAFQTGRSYATEPTWFFNGVRSTVDCLVQVKRVPVAPEIPGSDLPDWPTDPEDYTWDEETRFIYSKQPFSLVSGSFRWLSLYAESGDPAVVARYPLGPVLEQGDEDDNEAYWTAAYDAAVLAGDLPSGMTYNSAGTGGVTTYPRNASYAYTRTFTHITYSDFEGVTVGSIVRDQCVRSGLEDQTDFDVSNLDELIHGYKVERVMNGRDIIAPLRQFSLFDGLETDKLRFPLRGRAVVATLTDDDLGAHEFGSTPPPIVEAQRIEDIELPYAVRVRYADTDSEYQPGAQLATIKVTAGKSAVDVETTIAMDATDAAQMSEIVLQESVMRREDYTLRIGPHWFALTATDPILIPLRGEYQRAMISEDTRALPGIIEAKAMRDDDSIYTSNATGTPGGAGEQTLTQIGDTDLVLIDGPALGSGSNDGGLFVAACGASDRWRGFGLFESTDGGSNYSRIASYTLPSTMGTILDAIPEGPFDLWDYANSFTVAMDSGTLESRTQDEVVNGANAIFVGADGRWEVIQFADAVAEGIDSGGNVIYRLSTLLRGRQGTEWAIGSSQVGDRLALCITTNRLTMEVARIGIPRLFKAVSFGRTTESGPTQTFTPRGVALKPYAPTLPEGQRDGSSNLDIYAVRRTRIGAEWGDSDYVPLNEDVEAYEIDILSDGSPDSVLRILSGASFPITYTAAQQTTDFGSPQLNIRMRIYQISAAVGRGYPCEAIL